MSRKQHVVCDLCETVMSLDDCPPEPLPVDFNLNQLLHNINPQIWNDLYEAGKYSPLTEGNNIQFDICTDCLFDVLDTEEIKRRYEAD